MRRRPGPRHSEPRAEPCGDPAWRPYIDTPAHPDYVSGHTANSGAMAFVLGEIFGGAASKVREAGGTLAGGHTIRDPEPKYGLAVIGAAHPDKLLRKGGARPGDILILTKRLGTGVLVSGARQGRTSPEHLDGAIDQMRTLNRAAAEVLVGRATHAEAGVEGRKGVHPKGW